MSRLSILIVALFFSCLQYAGAQSFTTAADTIFAEVNTCPGNAFLFHNITNTTSAPLALSWHVTASNFPAAWLPHFDIVSYGTDYPNSALDVWNGSAGSTYTNTFNPVSTTSFSMMLQLMGVPLMGTYWMQIQITDPATSYSKNIYFVATRTATVYPPAAGVIVGDTSVCLATSITLSPSNAGGIWRLSNTNAMLLGSGSLVHLIGSTTGSDTVFYTITTACGADSTYKVVNIHSIVETAPITGPSLVCAGLSITLSDTIAGGSWTSTNASATVTGGVVHAVSVGIDTIVYTITNSCGTASVIHPFTIAPAPVPGPIGTDYEVCTGKNYYLYAVNPGGTWSLANGNATITGYVMLGVNAGLDTIFYTMTNGCGSISASAIVTVQATPAPVITLSGTTLSVPGIYYSYEWYLDGDDLYITGHSCPITTNGLYSVSVINSVGCSGSAEFARGLAATDMNAVNSGISIYPNPNNGTFSLNIPIALQQGAQVVISDVLGNKVITIDKISGDKITLKPALPAGIYMLNLTSPQGNAVSRLIIN